MAISVTLYERTPHKLVYRLISNGLACSAPDSGVITNRDVAPGAGAGDLSYDADTWHDQPLDKLVNIAGITTSVLAERLLMGRGLTAVADLPVERGCIRIIPQNPNQDVPGDNWWSARADTGNTVDPGARPAGSDGYACIRFTGPNQIDATAILTLEFQHSIDK